MRIAAIETRRYRYPLDPPFAAAWDPVPRDHQDATLVTVRSDDGVEGYASGDALPDRELLERLLVGVDPENAEVVHGVVETVDFHHGRNWTLEVAIWDLVARAHDQPLWRYLGGRQERLVAYASTAELVAADERVRRCLALREAGVRAVKLRLHSTDWRTDLPVLEAVRDAVGGDVDIMVDANQGWRMPGDLTPRWTREVAGDFARELERLDVYWLEEPLPTDDVEGYAELRRSSGVRIAAGEMVRSAAEARALVLQGGVDVIQPDVVLAGGIEGCRRVAELANGNGGSWSPHTWSNGYGLLANLHAALAFSTCPYVEVPYDPPAWSAERRDWLLPAAIAIAADGTIAPPDGPGLGVVPDLDALEEYRVA
jgi:L-alanine-DL-glutamate epimerase-like enolase superfamily enzyme